MLNKIVLACLFFGLGAFNLMAQLDPKYYDVCYFDESSDQYLYFEIDQETGGLCFFDPSYEKIQFDSGIYHGDIKIPGYVEYEGKQWSVNGVRAFSWCWNLISIEVPPTVTEISTSFHSCRELESVTLTGGNLNKIDNSFEDCPKLTQINIPEGVESIESSCSELGIETLDLPNSLNIIKRSFDNNSELQSVDLKKVCFVSDRSFNNCSLLSRVEIPANGIKITDSFNDCKAINEIVIWHEFIPFNENFQNSFNDVDFANCTLYVPEGSSDMYRNDKDGWGRFGKIIDNLPASVESVATENGAATGIYDLQGRRIDKAAKGEIYIQGGKKHINR